MIGVRRPQVPAIAAVLVVTAFGVVVAQPFIGVAASVHACGAYPRVPLEVNSSTEKVQILQDLATAYGKSARTIDGTLVCPQVTVDALNSGVAEKAFAAGWSSPTGVSLTTVLDGDRSRVLPEPDVWAPTSSMWPALAIATLAPGAPAAIPAPAPAGDPYPSLAYTPLVVAMPELKADALRQGLDRTPFDWSELPVLAKAVWGVTPLLSAGHHTDWGPFLFRKDQADDSTSGLAATIATYDAAWSTVAHEPLLGGDSAVAALGNKDVTTLVRTVESAIPADTGYSLDATQMMRDLSTQDATNPNGGWDPTSAVVISEQLLYQYDTCRLPPPPASAPIYVCAHGTRPTQLLRAFYPASGTLMLDHPYVVRAGLSARTAALAQDFLAYLERDGAAEFSAGGFRDRDGGLLPGLASLRATAGIVDDPPGGSIPLPSGAGIAAIQGSWRTLRKPGRIILLMDVSGSMVDNHDMPGGETRLAAAKAAAIAGITKYLGNPDDEIEIRTFPNAHAAPAPPYVVVRPSRTVGDASVIAAGISAINGNNSGDTPLYQNVKLARQTLQAVDDTGSVKAVIVMTDGGDTSGVSADAFAQSLTARPAVPVYFIAFGGDQAAKSALRNMAEIAGRLGGHAFDATVTGDTTIGDAFAAALSAT
jgi:Ca-activated chloride channel family protein